MQIFAKNLYTQLTYGGTKIPSSFPIFVLFTKIFRMRAYKLTSGFGSGQGSFCLKLL